MKIFLANSYEILEMIVKCQTSDLSQQVSLGAAEPRPALGRGGEGEVRGSSVVRCACHLGTFVY